MKSNLHHLNSHLGEPQTRTVLRWITETESQCIPFDRAMALLGSSEDADIQLSQGPELALRIEKRGEVFHLFSLTDGQVTINGSPFQETIFSPGSCCRIGKGILILDTELINSPIESQVETEKSVLAGLQEFTHVAGTETDLKRLLEQVLATISKELSATEALLFVLADNAQPRLILSSGIQKPEEHFSDTVVQDVLKNKQGIVLANAMTDSKYSGANSIVNLKLQSVVCVPILLAEKVKGLVYVGCRRGNRSYGQSELGIVQIYSLIAGMLIHHVDYIAQQQKSISRLTAADEGMIAASPAMKKIIEQILPLAPSDITILLQGETGTGKDVVAQFIHNKSLRKEKPFLAVNISSLGGELLESELFGYKKGAFTGAHQDREGLFKAARGGTLFLDELGEMHPDLQAKLLRSLETGKIRPVGSTAEEAVDVRVICATNRNLQSMVSEGKFREDLYYRLAQVVIPLPPLRERGEDIQILAYHFLEKFKAKYPHKVIRDFHPDALQALMSHEWPGNVRELVNVVHRALLSSPGEYVQLDMATFKEKFAGLDEATQRFQRNYISRALILAGGNKEQAAQILQMSRSTFFRYLSQLNLVGQK